MPVSKIWTDGITEPAIAERAPPEAGTRDPMGRLVLPVAVEFCGFLVDELLESSILGIPRKRTAPAWGLAFFSWLETSRSWSDYWLVGFCLVPEEEGRSLTVWL
jgi:hypothetical protein